MAIACRDGCARNGGRARACVEPNQYEPSKVSKGKSAGVNAFTLPRPAMNGLDFFCAPAGRGIDPFSLERSQTATHPSNGTKETRVVQAAKHSLEKREPSAGFRAMSKDPPYPAGARLLSKTLAANLTQIGREERQAAKESADLENIIQYGAIAAVRPSVPATVFHARMNVVSIQRAIVIARIKPKTGIPRCFSRKLQKYEILWSS